jgi:hypothetical protein
MEMQQPSEQGVRSDLAAHDHAIGLPISEVVKELAEILGATTVAAIAGVTETRAVQQWMGDRQPQRPHVLRFALQLASMIGSVKNPEYARAWFQASNPHLGDAVPTLLLRNKPLEEVQGQLMAAARAFAAR